jgi:thiol-disulfide isomerase/thioredoxin
MARTETIAHELGFVAPDFRLPDLISGNILSLAEVAGEKATLLMFICNHCPYVRHIMPALVKLEKEFAERGIRFAAINSNDIEEYPEDAPEKMISFAQEYGFDFPYFFDETQEVAKKYFAACTPDFNLFDEKLRCVYRGNFDDSTPKNGVPVTGNNMREAFECLLNQKTIPAFRPSVGCNIKWKN